jgi:GNAT superfamily N-acetyltransferase
VHPRLDGLLWEASVSEALDGITYRIGGDLDLDQVIDLYRASTLGERRPVDNRTCMQEMIDKASLIVTAWDGEHLVGISRTLTDFCYVAYLADLAVDQTYQRKGIGRELIGRTQSALASGATIVLLAAPAAESYYPHVGFTHHPQAWILHPSSRVT